MFFKSFSDTEKLREIILGFGVVANKILICVKQCSQTAGYRKKNRTVGKRDFQSFLIIKWEFECWMYFPWNWANNKKRDCVFFQVSRFFKNHAILHISGHQELWWLNFLRQIKYKGFSNFLSMVFPGLFYI